MKIRTGFVTNSSSTSFCIVGTCLELSEAEEWFKRSLKVIAAAYKQRTGQELDTWSIQEEFPYSLRDVIDLNVYSDGECSCYVGLDIESMKDDETLGEFKQRVVGMMSGIGIIEPNAKVEIIAETISE